MTVEQSCAKTLRKSQAMSWTTTQHGMHVCNDFKRLLKPNYFTCSGNIRLFFKQTKKSMHWPGIEPGPPTWQARILPLNHQCYINRILIRCSLYEQL